MLTKGNLLKDVVVEMVAKDGCSNIATIIGNKQTAMPEVPLSSSRTTYRLCKNQMMVKLDKI